MRRRGGAPASRRAQLSTALLLLLGLLAALAPTAPAAAPKWTLRQMPPVRNAEGEAIEIGLNSISCPSEALCVAVGGRQATVAVSQDPTGGVGSWHWTKLEYPVGPGKTCVAGEDRCEAPSGALQGVSCASERLCALVTYDGWIFVSTDPAGGTGAWSPVNVNLPGQKGGAHLTSVSCPTASFCAAVSGGSNNANGGRVLTSVDPAGGEWRTAQLGDRLDLRSVSCGTPSLCVVAGREGRLFTSTDPAGGASAWDSAGTPAGPGDLEGASCVGTALCAVGNMTGNVLTSTDPAAGPGASWSEVDAGSSVQITGVSCPNANACLVVDNNGDVMASTEPTGRASAWTFENLLPFTPEGQPHNALFGASCASTSLCALVGGEGRIFTSTSPFAAPDPPHGTLEHGHAPRRPKTFLLFAERFYRSTVSERHRVRARFRFFSPTRTKGFECKRDRGPYRRCRSPLRYWTKHGFHVLRVRAIGPTGLRGPAATQRFCFLRRQPEKRSEQRRCGIPPSREIAPGSGS